MMPDAESMTGMIVFLVIVGGLAWAVPSLIKYVRAQDRDRKELLDLMREQNRNRDDE